MAFCRRASALSLFAEAIFSLSHNVACSFDIIALMVLAVTINREIDDAEIHSDEIGRRRRRDISNLNGHKQ